MDVVDVDLLSVLPVTISASAALARAADFSPDRDERQGQLRSLMTTLSSGEPITVVLKDAIGTERRCVCRPLRRCGRHISCLPEKTPSRPAQTGLVEVTEATCVLRRHGPPFSPGGPCGG